MENENNVQNVKEENVNPQLNQETEINIIVVINHDKFLSLITPGNMCDTSIT